jgi:putative peptidoglycan lipid II flippase
MLEPNLSQTTQPIAKKRPTVLGTTVLGLSGLAVLAKVFGFGEKLVIAHFFGAQDMADVYFASIGIVLSVVFLVKELIYPSLLPIFTQCLSQSERDCGALFAKVFMLAALILTGAAVFAALFSGSLACIVAPGFSPEKKQLTADMLRYLSPAALFLSLTAVTYTVLNARKNFLNAAWPDTALKFFIVAGLILLIPLWGIYATAVVLAIGAMALLVIHFCFIPDRVFLLATPVTQGNDALRKVLLLMSPLAVGVLCSHVNGLIDNILASTLPSGHLSYLGYSKKVVDAIIAIGPAAIVTIIYTQLAGLAAAQDINKFKQLLIKAVRLLLYISIPTAILLVGLNKPFIRVLFERGRFDAAATTGTAQAFLIYSAGFVTFSLEMLIVYAFYAISNTKTPVKTGIVCVCLNIAVAVILLRPLGYIGIALAFVLAKTVKVILLSAILEKKFQGLFSVELCMFAGKLILASILAAIALKLLSIYQSGQSFAQIIIFDLIVPATGFILVFAVSSFLLKIEESKFALTILRTKKHSFCLAGGQNES